MKNLVLFIKNINNYGFIVFVKIIFFEIFYTLKILDFKSLKYEVFKNDIYELTKKIKFITLLIFLLLIFFKNS